MTASIISRIVHQQSQYGLLAEYINGVVMCEMTMDALRKELSFEVKQSPDFEFTPDKRFKVDEDGKLVRVVAPWGWLNVYLSEQMEPGSIRLVMEEK